MNDFAVFKEIINKRKNIDDEWNTEIEKCWTEMINMFSANIEKTIKFLDEDCTADEFSWMSEIFEEIAEKTKSFKFISALRRLAIKYPQETEKYNINSFIDSAEAIIQSES